MTGLAPHLNLHLRAGVHGALVGGDLVLLDTEADAYSCLLDAVRDGTASDNGSDPLGAVRHELAEAGYLTGEPAPRRRATIPPRRTAGVDLAVRATGAERRDFIATAAQMTIDYHPRPLRHLLRVAGLRRRTATSPEIVARRAALFVRWAPWIPFQGACLYRAFFLLNYLRRAGLDADWIFGVRTWPFSAHCWLQVEDVVLDDDLDRVLAYTPILAA